METTQKTINSLEDRIGMLSGDLTILFQTILDRLNEVEGRIAETRGMVARRAEGRDNPVFAEINHLQKRMTAIEDSLEIIMHSIPAQRHMDDPQETQVLNTPLSDLLDRVEALTKRID
jgi:tetrahydromethanopterin S-methyltransferase subunit G